jgi:hypothetical protein
LILYNFVYIAVCILRYKYSLKKYQKNEKEKVIKTKY